MSDPTMEIETVAVDGVPADGPDLDAGNSTAEGAQVEEAYTPGDTDPTGRGGPNDGRPSGGSAPAASIADLRRAQRAVVPTDGERSFHLEELFFSTTDLRGVITAGNDVFVRVSGYAEHEIIGAPHNLIRHPDMPRAVFHLLWEYITTGRPIAAYVKNMAADGGYYWVMAVVTPVEGGYLSVRLKPSSDLFDLVPNLYRELRRLEQEVEQSGEGRKEAIAAATAHLQELIADAGFASYDAFMGTALRAEISARAATLDAIGHGFRRSAGRPGSGGGAATQRLARIIDASRSVYEHLTRLYLSIDGYMALSGRLESSRFLLDLGDEIRLFSLNAVVAAAHLDGDGASLGAVADLMRTRSDRTAQSIRALEDEIAEVSGALGDLSFRTSVARLQTEMTTIFGQQVGGRSGGDGTGVATALWAGVHALSGAVRDDLKHVSELQARIARISRRFDLLREDLKVLSVLQLNGRVEAARSADSGRFLVLFDEIGGRLRAAQREVEDLAGAATAASAQDQSDHVVAWDLRDLQEGAAAMAQGGVDMRDTLDLAV